MAEPERPAPASADPDPTAATTAVASTGGRKLSTKSAGIVGGAVMISRVLGLIREQIFAGLFGAGASLDAFLTAFRTPNLLRDLFAEGALSTAFVTTFSKKIATEGDASAWKLANKVATLAAVFMSGITILGIVFAPAVIGLLAPGFSAEKMELTILLARIMYPFILLVSLAALVMGMLNAKQVFGMPALASSFFNLGSIAGGVLLGRWFDPSFGTQSLIGLSIGTLIGGLLQLAVQIPSLFQIGYRFRPDFHWRDEGVKTVLKLMGPAVIAASAVQVNVVVNNIFASYLQDGAVSFLNIAFRLMQLPLGIFGVAIGTVTLPLISQSAAAGNTAEFRAILAHGIRLAVVLTVPSAVGLIILADPIIGVLYQHGKFTGLMTAQTAAALQYYAVGLIAYSAIKVLAPAFYAIDKRKTPMMVSFGSIAMNLLLNWALTFGLKLGHKGLALSTGIVACVNFGVLYFLMAREVKGLETGRLLGVLGKLLVCSLGLAAVCVLANMFLFAQPLPFMQKLLSLAGVIAVAAVVFFGLATALKVEEVHEVVKVAQRKLRRRGK